MSTEILINPAYITDDNNIL